MSLIAWRDGGTGRGVVGGQQRRRRPLRHALAGRANVAVLPNGIDREPWQVDPVAGEPGEMRLVAVMRLTPVNAPCIWPGLCGPLRAGCRPGPG